MEPSSRRCLWYHNFSRRSSDTKFIDIKFKEGKPVALNGKEMKLLTLSRSQCYRGKHGVGRIDTLKTVWLVANHVNLRMPRCYHTLTAHEIEDITLVVKCLISNQFLKMNCQTLFNALWFSPATKAICLH